MRIIKTFPKLLSREVRFFYSMVGEASYNTRSIHRRLPDGTLDLVFNLGSPVFISGDGLNFQPLSPISLSGLFPDRRFIQYTGVVHLVGIVFQPGYANWFMNDDLDNFSSCTADASTILGPDLSFVFEELALRNSITEKRDVIEKFLIKYLQNKRKKRCNQVLSALDNIYRNEGHVDVSSLAKDQHMSERSFRRNFLASVGMSPKQFAGIIRVKSFGKNYQKGHSDFSDLLEDLGYTDLSHLNKEFQRIAGLSPTHYFKQLDQVGSAFIQNI